MIKRVFFLLATITSALYGNECLTSVCETECCGANSSLSANVGIGYRRDSLRWNTKGQSPSVHIREKWKGIDFTAAEANLRFLACDFFVFKAGGDYAWAGTQKRFHTKFSDPNSNVFYKRHFKTKANAYDLSAAIGLQFNMNAGCYHFSFTPLVGYAYNRQHFKNPPFYANSYHGSFRQRTFASNYWWSTGWAGFESVLQPRSDWMLYLSGAGHWGKNHAKVKEFLTGEHISKVAKGIEGTVGTAYQFCSGAYLGVKLNYKYFTTSRGDNRIKNLAWHSFFVAGDLGYAF